MPNPVFYVFGAIAFVTLALTERSFAVFRIAALGIAFAAATAIFGGAAWLDGVDSTSVRLRQGAMMEKVHQTILSSLEFDGNGSLPKVGCSSGALSVRAALLLGDSGMSARR